MNDFSILVFLAYLLVAFTAAFLICMVIIKVITSLLDAEEEHRKQKEEEIRRSIFENEYRRWSRERRDRMGKDMDRRVKKGGIGS